MITPVLQILMPMELIILGYIVGEYRLADNISRGFIFDGTNFSTIKTPIIDQATSTEMIAYGINDSGVVVGLCAGMSGTWYQRGFVLNGDNLCLVNYPGANKTTLCGINNNGELVGWSDGFSSSSIGFKAELSDMTIIPTPLPGAVILLGAGLGRLVLYGRRKMTRQKLASTIEIFSAAGSATALLFYFLMKQRGDWR